VLRKENVVPVEEQISRRDIGRVRSSLHYS
jgi:hypothetical protein